MRQLARQPRSPRLMRLNPAVGDLFAFRHGDFHPEGYDSHPATQARVAVRG
jgi:thymidylate synthase